MSMIEIFRDHCFFLCLLNQFRWHHHVPRDWRAHDTEFVLVLPEEFPCFVRMRYVRYVVHHFHVSACCFSSSQS